MAYKSHKSKALWLASILACLVAAQRSRALSDRERRLMFVLSENTFVKTDAILLSAPQKKQLLARPTCGTQSA